MIIGLLILFVLITLLVGLRIVSYWCRRASVFLEASQKENLTRTYLQELLKEEKNRKEKIKEEVTGSKYLTPEFMVLDVPTDRKAKADQIKVSDFLKRLDDN